MRSRPRTKEESGRGGRMGVEPLWETDRRNTASSASNPPAITSDAPRATSIGVSSTLTLGRLTMIFARCTNSSVRVLSARSAASGETVASSAVRAFPPRLSRSRKVSFESRKCTWRCRPAARSTSAPITSPRAESERLMLPDSFRPSSLATPSMRVRRCRSEPARSTRASRDDRAITRRGEGTAAALVLASLLLCTYSEKTACERELSRFILVAPTCRERRPRASSCIAALSEPTSVSVSASTYTPCSGFSRTCRPSAGGAPGMPGVNAEGSSRS